MSQLIEYQKFKRGETCTEEACRARKLYIEDGKKFCQRGHEQFGFRQTQQDEDDWNAQGKKSRKVREQKEKLPTVLSGNEAREHYLLCYQYVLWKQCFWLRTVKGFPGVLEGVVRDLWGLRVRSWEEKRDERSGYGSQSETGTMMFSSQSEWDTEDEGMSVGERERRKKGGSEEKLPTLVQTLGLCYLGMLLMKFPVSLGDILRWATCEGMTYARAISEIPKEMRVKLPGHFHYALEMKSVLKGSTLHRAVQELVELYAVKLEMQCPPVNAPGLILKHIIDLGLPVEIYPAVQRLAKLLDINYSWPITVRKADVVSAYPEIQMMSLIIIATKLHSPFDDIPRVPIVTGDPSSIRISWSKWMHTMAKGTPPGLEKGAEVNVVETDVFSMSGKKMDDYLDWYQRTWIDDRDSKVPEQLLQLFPLEEVTLKEPEAPDMEKTTLNLKEIQSSMTVQNHLPLDDLRSSNVNRPGELYRRYRTVEELPEIAKAFFEKAGMNAGISLDLLVKSVFKFELKLANWVLEERRREE